MKSTRNLLPPFLLAALLLASEFSVAQSLNYGSAFDPQAGSLVSTTQFSVGSEESGPGGIAFNDTGDKMFIIGSSGNDINQYTLAKPFDVTTALFDGNPLDVSVAGFSGDLAFNSDGTKLFVVGSTDAVHQYSLSIPYNVTSGATYDNISFSVASEESQPNGLAFSADGLKMFIMGFVGRDVNQYSLSSPFDISAGVTFDGNPLTAGGGPIDLYFNPDGSLVFIVDFNTDEIFKYSLSSAYDLMSTTTQLSTFSVAPENQPMSLAFNAIGTRAYILGRDADQVIQYTFAEDFSESTNNDGSVEGSLLIDITDDQFTNAGSTLTGSDYAVTNLPSGLTSTLTVASDGLSATLTLGGNATLHQNSDDLSGLIFTFQNSAFVGGDASMVANATSANSNIGIDFDTNNPRLVYGFPYDPSTAVQVGGPYDVSPQESSPTGFTFNSDGTKLYVTGGSGADVNQYSLATPYDITAGVSFDGSPYSVSTEDIVPVDIEFNTSGTKMFVLGGATRAVYQYTLTTPFDVTAGVSLDAGSLSITSEESSPAGIAFSNDGTKMYLIGTNNDAVFQYSLSSPFDITTGVSFDGAPFSVASEQLAPREIAFNNDGTEMFIVGTLNNEVNEYSLKTPFDITDDVTFNGATFNVSGLNIGFVDIAFDTKGSRMFILRTVGGNEINQYELDPGGFAENSVNDGSLDGSLTIHLFDDQFTNAGSTLTDGVNYAVNNLPAGFTPVLTVAADGFSAVLTLTGNASNHQDVDDLNDLQFTFRNSAFTNNPAASVANAENADSNVGIDFRDNNPAITYGFAFDFSNGATFSGPPLDVSSEVLNAHSVAFSPDGLKMFILSDNISSNFGSLIYQYSLSTPFDVTSGVTHDGSPYNVSNEEAVPFGLAFGSGGTKMFIVGAQNQEVNQYTLSTPYDITSGVSFDGSPYSVFDGTNIPVGIVFNTDGSKMFLLMEGNDEVRQYSLTTPFDVTSGVSLVGSAFSVAAQESAPTDITFNADGTKMFIIGSTGDDVNQYSLLTPFDVGSAVFDGSPFAVGSQETSPTGMAFNSAGSRLFVIGLTGDDVNQYDLNVGGFTEAVANDGSVEGSLSIMLRDDQFTNASGTLTASSDYSINNLPTGLVPNLAVASDGLSADLTFGGNADEASNVDITSLQFTFENSAFVNSNAGDVDNSILAESNVGIDFLPSDQTDILTFDLAEQTGPAVINATNHTVDIEVDFGTDVTTLSPTITLSFGASVSPVSGTQMDFTNPVTYSVTAEDGSTIQDWQVTVTIAPNTENDIVSFTFTEINGSSTINATAHTVIAEAVAGTDISSISPAITISVNATISPLSGTAQDFSSAVTYTVTAEDTTPQDWSVTITEQLASPTDISLSSENIDENVASRTGVGTLSTVDASFSDSHSYMLVAGAGDTDNGSFSIVGDELRSAEIFDFETKSTYSIRIETNDGNGGLFEEAFTISINDVNEVPTDISLDNLTIDESNPVGSLVGSFTTTDEDTGQSFTYSLVPGAGDADNGSFSIVGDELQSGEVFDFETRNSYVIRVQTDDGNGGTFEEAFTISINDLPASVTSLDLSNNSINENESAGTLVGSFTTSGEDLSGSFTYTLVSGSGDTDNSFFSISGNQLLSGGSFDFEAKSSFSIRVMTDDGAGNTLEDIFSVTITDVAEAPTDISLTATSINENNTVGDAIGSFMTTDEDMGETHTYSLVAGTGDSGNSAFSISGSELQAAVVFDFEVQDSYSIRVQTDDGNGGTYQESFTITVNDQNESIVVSNPLVDQVLTEGFVTLDLDVSSVFTDQDGDALTYSVVSSDEEVVTATISGATLTLTEVAVGSAIISVDASDGSGSSTTDDFMVTVDEAPNTETDITAFTLAEQTGDATIDATNHTVSIEVEEGTDVTSLTPTIVVSEGATISPSGSQDFTSAITYTVTAEDGSTTQDWTATITVEDVPLGLEDRLEVEVYPNPASQYVNVRSAEHLTVELVGLDGRELRRDTGREVKLDIRALRSGVYILMIESTTSSVRQRIIKTN